LNFNKSRGTTTLDISRKNLFWARPYEY